MQNFQATHWSLLDLQYEYLDDGYKIIATTDVPCHLYCRITTTPPRKHSLPSGRRGLRLTGDIRFCFVVYEDNAQDEAGDTLIHTFYKHPWPICETRWFYFVGQQGGSSSASETCIFKFHFPAPPPPPPPPIIRTFYAKDDNRTIQYEVGVGLTVLDNYSFPNFALFAGCYQFGGNHYIWRSFLNFDISTLPLSAKILTATLQLFIYSQSNDQVAKGIITQHGTHNIPVTIADWNHFEAPLFYRKQFPMTLNAYNNWLFNADGLASLKANLGSSSYKLANRGGLDYDNGFHAIVHFNRIWYYSQQKGVTYAPRLTITYYPA